VYSLFCSAVAAGPGPTVRCLMQR